MMTYQLKMRLAGKPPDKTIDCGTKPENAQAFGNTCRTTGFFERQAPDIIARAGITASAPVPYNDYTTW